jgi:hypothetical protein
MVAQGSVPAALVVLVHGALPSLFNMYALWYSARWWSDARSRLM